MEPIFTNVCTHTKEALQDGFYSLQKRRRIIPIILFSLLTLAALYDFWYYLDYLYLIFTPALIFTPVYVYGFSARLNARTFYKRAQELYHEPLEQTMMFYEDHIETKNRPSNAEATIRYDQIKRVIGSKQHYTILIRQRMILILDKSRFDKVNLFEFEKFMHEKAPKAKFLLH